MTEDHLHNANPILAAGRNCWIADAPVEESGLLVDGRDYYRAFWEAARQCKRYLLIAGWRFNSDVRLMRGADAEEIGGEVKFLPFLDDLCVKNPDLRIYILTWDFSVIYAHEWELFQESKFQQAPHGRLQFRFDSEHAIGASHHQKFAVVDGVAGFVGGLDFNSDDWDDRRHLAFNPDRCDSGKEPHDPYHDIQAYLTGPAVRELTAYFEARWRTAGGDALNLPSTEAAAPIRITPTIPITASQIAFSHNKPKTLSNPNDSYHLRQLHVDAIAAAEELIYIENQYFSSTVVLQALLERMRAADRPKLDIAVVLPKRFPSWVESFTLGPPRFRMLEQLREAAGETGHRLGVYYTAAPSVNGDEVPVLIHSKLLLVDDRFLTVGSCNTSNRSMGLDTELHVAWEATWPAQASLVESIRRSRIDLLAEHCGLKESEASRRLAPARGLVDRLDEICRIPGLRLRRLTPELIAEDQEWLKKLDEWGFSFDPATPLIEDTLYEQVLPASDAWLAEGLTLVRDFFKPPAKEAQRSVSR
jgi:phosphatidylserine/phosphatidylglycerophosphate/cardiolipin synthase-like enzyme